MAVNNFHIIREFLNFEEEDDFYFIQVMQRKKDAYEGEVKGTNNSARLVKGYYVRNIDYFDKLEEEIKKLSEVFGARATINLNRRSKKRVAFHTLKKITDQIMNENYKDVANAYNAACGKYSKNSEKRWIIDIDDPERDDNDIIEFINNELKPDGDKFVGRIPSKNGYHLITTPFNLKDFSEKFSGIEIHKNNPTNLYIPD